MQHGVLVVQTEPKIGREPEFEKFCNTIHGPAVLQTPGLRVAGRYRAIESESLPQWPFEAGSP